MSNLFTCPPNYSNSETAFNTMKNICKKVNDPKICSVEWETFRRTGSRIDLNTYMDCMNGVKAPIPLSDLKNQTVSTACRLGACSTEFLFKSANFGDNMFSAIENLWKTGGAFIKTVLLISWIIVILLAVKYTSKVIPLLSNNLLGSGNKATFYFLAGAMALLYSILMFSGETWIGVYVGIACLFIIILSLLVVNIILTLKGVNGWRGPAGFQMIFMIIISIATLISAIWLITKIIKQQKVGEHPESVAPFTDFKNAHNWAYILLFITIGLSVFFIIISILRSGKVASNIRSTAGRVLKPKTDTMIGYITTVFLGLIYGFNLVLGVTMPVASIVFSTFERVIGAIITMLGDNNSMFSNMLVNLGSSIDRSNLGVQGGADLLKKHKTIGEEFFGGGKTNGWSPVGTLLANIIIAMMTNYNVVLSRDIIDLNANVKSDVYLPNTTAFKLRS